MTSYHYTSSMLISWWKCATSTNEIAVKRNRKSTWKRKTHSQDLNCFFQGGLGLILYSIHKHIHPYWHHQLRTNHQWTCYIIIHSSCTGRVESFTSGHWNILAYVSILARALHVKTNPYSLIWCRENVWFSYYNPFHILPASVFRIKAVSWIWNCATYAVMKIYSLPEIAKILKLLNKV